MAIQRITSHGFWRHGSDFLKAADKVMPVPKTLPHRARLGTSMVAYYLLGHAIELCLKSYLFAKGYSEKILRNPKLYGHNIEALLKECRKRKLGREVKLTRAESRAIFLLSDTYRTKKFEYLEYGLYQLPEYFFLREVTVKLVKGLARYAMNPPFNQSKKAQPTAAGTH